MAQNSVQLWQEDRHGKAESTKSLAAIDADDAQTWRAGIVSGDRASYQDL